MRLRPVCKNVGVQFPRGDKVDPVAEGAEDTRAEEGNYFLCFVDLFSKLRFRILEKYTISNYLLNIKVQWSL